MKVPLLTLIGGVMVIVGLYPAGERATRDFSDEFFNRAIGATGIGIATCGGALYWLISSTEGKELDWLAWLIAIPVLVLVMVWLVETLVSQYRFEKKGNTDCPVNHS